MQSRGNGATLIALVSRSKSKTCLCIVPGQYSQQQSCALSNEIFLLCWPKWTAYNGASWCSLAEFVRSAHPKGATFMSTALRFAGQNQAQTDFKTGKLWSVNCFWQPPKLSVWELATFGTLLVEVARAKSTPSQASLLACKHGPSWSWKLWIFHWSDKGSQNHLKRVKGYCSEASTNPLKAWLDCELGARTAFVDHVRKSS